MKLLDEIDDDDPGLSLINLIDVFLVVIAALMMAVAASPLNPFDAESVTVIRNPGTAEMEIVIKQGDSIERFEAQGQSSVGDGVRAGTAYRLEDGSLIYVPE